MVELACTLEARLDSSTLVLSARMAAIPRFRVVDAGPDEEAAVVWLSKEPVGFPDVQRLSYIKRGMQTRMNSTISFSDDK